MKHNDWFKEWFGSPYYKILYCERDLTEAEEFVEKLIEHLHPLPGSRMLDIACGEGRYAIQLAQHGFDVTGIDLSEASIEKAKAHGHDHLHFAVQDMRRPFRKEYFDYAFNFFTSFGYFTVEEDNLMAARSFAHDLKKGGLLVVDYMNVSHVINNLVAEDTIVRDSYTFHIRRRAEDDLIIKDIRFEDKSGQERSYSESVAAFNLADFIEIFRQANLTLVSTFGDYSLNAYNPATSPRLIMIFKK